MLVLGSVTIYRPWNWHNHWKQVIPKGTFIFQPLIFRGYLQGGHFTLFWIFFWEGELFLAILCDLFGMFLVTLLNGESWPPTFGDEKVTTWITWLWLNLYTYLIHFLFLGEVVTFTILTSTFLSLDSNLKPPLLNGRAFRWSKGGLPGYQGEPHEGSESEFYIFSVEPRLGLLELWLLSRLQMWWVRGIAYIAWLTSMVFSLYSTFRGNEWFLSSTEEGAPWKWMVFSSHVSRMPRWWMFPLDCWIAWPQLLHQWADSEPGLPFHPSFRLLFHPFVSSSKEIHACVIQSDV